jgi:FkbM family methyltransferase
MSYGNTIENELFWLGKKGWEAKSTSVWKQLSEKSSVIFDVGANTGLYSLISAKVNPSASVYAFEPLEHVRKRLEKNLSINNLSVNCFSLALSDENGEARIYAAYTISGTFDQASLNAERFEKIDRNFTTIQTQRLDTFIESNNVKDIDLMKIDVETFEPHVLRGMGAYLARFSPTMLVEILNETIGNEIEILVGGLNYEYYFIDETRGFIRKHDLKPGKRGGNFLLLNRKRHPELDFKVVD